MTKQLDRIINGYRLVSYVGNGEFGEVWKGKHVLDESIVAIKFPKNENDYIKEVKALGMLDHPAIPELIDYNDQDQAIITQFVKGKTLEQLCDDEDPSFIKLGHWLADVLDAVMHVHSMGMAHGDLGGQNIMITPQNRGFIVDFGLADFSPTRSCVRDDLSYLAEALRTYCLETHPKFWAVVNALEGGSPIEHVMEIFLG